ncbi:transglycosylase domain-containing protein [Candidatus Fermentibacterales bacterium]|nr:transglycosylase domain-containing protein [Candidatus Fermentibacterales bacterium]
MKLLLRLVGLALVALLAYSGYVIVDAISRTGPVVDSLMSPGCLPTPLDEFPEQWLDALVEIEDPAFLTHHGVDLRTPGAGERTITQYLAGQLYPSDFLPFMEELRVSLIAFFVLDPKVAKDVQLLIYVNCVELGEVSGAQVRGFAQAAEAYFEKQLPDLEDDEFLSLVAMLLDPSRYDPVDHPMENAVRVERIRSVLDGSYARTGRMDVRYYGEDE